MGWVNVTHDSKDESEKHYTDQKKTDPKTNIPCDFIYLVILGQQGQSLTTEVRIVVPSGVRHIAWEGTQGNFLE